MVMFTFWPPVSSSSSSSSFGPPSFSQLSLPDQLDLAHHHHHQPSLSPACSCLPHSFPKGIDDAFYHCPRRNNGAKGTKKNGAEKRSVGTQTDNQQDTSAHVGAVQSVVDFSEDEVEDTELKALCTELAECLLRIADGWAAKQMEEKQAEGPKGMFGRVCALFRCC